MLDQDTRQEVELLVEHFKARLHELGCSCSITLVADTTLYLQAAPRVHADEAERFLVKLVANATSMVVRKLDATVGEPVPVDNITALIQRYSGPYAQG